MLFYIVTALFVSVCLLLMVVILLQQGKGGDIAAAFGGGGSGSQTAFGARSGATVLSRATSVLAILFVLGAMVLGIMGRAGGGSVITGGPPAAAPLPAGAGITPTAPATTPATPAPEQ